MTDETRITEGPLQRIQIGTRLNDTYQIDSLIAVGGMGEVYKGHVIETGDEVAIKIILPEFAQNVSALALFRKEASALHTLYHEAIVRYFVFSIDKLLGLPYLAMEYVTGESLSEVLRRGPLDVASIQVLIRRLAAGLQAAHDLGIVHRDISPDNIVLPRGDPAQAKIIDFGIARSPLGEKTVIGSGFAGKFSYVSPEQLGLQGGDVTPRSDIYSLGIVLAQAALGRALDMGQTHADVIEKRRSVPDLGFVDARIRPLITAMLQPRPEDRPASMAEVANWSPAKPTGAKPAPSRKLAYGLSALLLLVGAGAAFVLVTPLTQGWQESPGPRDGPRPGLEEQVSANPPPAAPPLAPADRQASSGGNTGSAADPGQLQAAPPNPGQPPPKAATPAPSSPEVVRLPEAAPSPSRPAPTMEIVAGFITEYRGGSCFFISPVSVSHREAVIEGFGSSATPFETLDSDFKRALGFEPRIQLRQVTEPQCPAIDFLARQAGQRRSRVPKLTIVSDRIRSLDELSGTADAGGDPHVELLLVDDTGLVHNISSYAKRTGDGLAFTLRIAGKGAEAKPQLVLAVGSAKPIPNLGRSGSMRAADLFKQVDEESARLSNTVTVAIRYFKLGG